MQIVDAQRSPFTMLTAVVLVLVVVVVVVVV